MEPATVIWNHPSGGRLLLGGLPTEAQRDVLEKCSLIISCFEKDAEQVWVKERGQKVYGWVPNSARRLRWRISDDRHRSSEWKDIAYEALATVRQGENVLLHCRAGIHRAAMGTVKLLAWLADMSAEDAVEQVEARRAVDLQSILKDGDDGEWVRSYVTLRPLEQIPSIDGFARAANGQFAHCMSGSTPVCKWRKSRGAQKELFRSGVEHAENLEGIAANVKGICRDCALHLSASQRKLAVELFGDKALG